jgi:outer membrane protein assembly factor BamB
VALAEEGLNLLVLSKVTLARTLLLAGMLLACFGAGTAALPHRAAEPPPAGALLARFAPLPTDPEPKETPALAEWAMFRGSAERSARGKGTLTSLQLLWSVPTARDKQTLEWVQKGLHEGRKAGAGVVPAFHPLGVGGKVIFRTYRGLTAVKGDSAGVLWENVSRAGLDELLDNEGSSREVTAWVTAHQRAGRAEIVIDNSALGEISTDGKYVYAVEDLAVPPAAENLAVPTLPPVLGRHPCRLQATNLVTGKLTWELGDDIAGPEEFVGGHFSGPPLPLNGHLYALLQKGEELRLVCIDPPAFPRGPFTVAWNEKLAALDPVLVTSLHRIQAAPIAADGDLLVCPTNAGKVIGFDLKKRKVAWTHEYRPAKLGGALDAGWKATGPIVHGGKVIVTAPDCEEVVCLWPGDGKVCWRAKRAGDRYVAGVFGNDVLLVGDESCRALSLAHGTLRWKIDTGRPTGMGVGSGDLYYLPLASFGKSGEPEVCVLDLRAGAVKAHLKTGTRDPPGNLTLCEGRLLSQTANAVSAFVEKPSGR